MIFTQKRKERCFSQNRNNAALVPDLAVRRATLASLLRKARDDGIRLSEHIEGADASNNAMVSGATNHIAPGARPIGSRSKTRMHRL